SVGQPVVAGRPCLVRRDRDRPPMDLRWRGEIVHPVAGCRSTNRSRGDAVDGDPVTRREVHEVRPFRIALLAGLGAFASPSLAAQVSPPPSPTAIVSGTVHNVATGAPVRTAVV